MPGNHFLCVFQYFFRVFHLSDKTFQINRYIIFIWNLYFCWQHSLLHIISIRRFYFNKFFEMKFLWSFSTDKHTKCNQTWINMSFHSIPFHFVLFYWRSSFRHSFNFVVYHPRCVVYCVLAVSTWYITYFQLFSIRINSWLFVSFSFVFVHFHL